MKKKKQPINNANRRDFIKMSALGATAYSSFSEWSGKKLLLMKRFLEVIKKLST